MPRNVITYDLMLSSPGDVSAERDVVENEVAVLHRRLQAQGLGVSIIRWETDATPAFGADPQEQINSQLPDYDVFVGIFWSRFGTPTPRALSGTEEEFREARQRWKRDVHGREIMLYFGDAPVSAMLDVEQLQRVQAFRKEVASLGLLGSFNSTQDFRAKFSRDIEKVILRLHRRHCRPLKPAASPPARPGIGRARRRHTFRPPRRAPRSASAGPRRDRGARTRRPSG